MNDILGAKEPLCNLCTHKEVCAYKQDYLYVFKEAKNATMKLANHDFIGAISVGCKYYQAPKYVAYRPSEENEVITR